MQQHIRFCTSGDGVRIALSTSGHGPPLVKAANWLSHLEFDWNSPVWRHWLAELSRYNTFVRYDQRGCGLSDWDVSDLSLEAWVLDLETVIDSLKLERFSLLGMSQGASIAITYAVRHPEKVSHLILYGGYARGLNHRELTPEQKEELEVMIQLIKIGWGKEHDAFRQVFTSLFLPDGTLEQLRAFNDLERITTTPEIAARIVSGFQDIDVRHQAEQVTQPTLVLHAKNDLRVPFEEGRLVAALIPGARFVPLESRNHVLLEDEPAWGRFLAEVRSFLGVGADAPEASPQSQPVFPELTSREHEVLELIAQGLDNTQIADRLVVSQKTVRNHTTHIFQKLGVRNRAQAIVLARQAGLGHLSHN